MANSGPNIVFILSDRERHFPDWPAENPTQARDFILTMNSLLNRTLDQEVGTDDGSFLPTGTETAWEIDRWDV
ncbi:MAG: hypothetical protein QNM02_04195 [Acidimicrobiia bacterium]|nr:hypothetical protein [Acidimicrobiia bacterium]